MCLQADTDTTIIHVIKEVPHEGSPVSVAEVSLSNSDHIEETRTATPTTPGTQTFPSAVAAAALNNLTGELTSSKTLIDPLISLIGRREFPT